MSGSRRNVEVCGEQRSPVSQLSTLNPQLFSTVPECQTAPARAVCLEIDPEKIQPALSVQAAWNHGLGIQRGLKKGGILQEDCITEILVEGRMAPSPAPIVGTGPMRQHLWSVREHQNDFASRHPHWKLWGAVGNGNLLCNPFFVGYAGGRLFRLGSEAPALERRVYTCLVTWTAGASPRRVTIEPLRFAERDGRGRVYSERLARDITREIEFATFGQQIVRGGQPLASEELTRMVVEGQFYDLRHRFLFGRCQLGSDRWLDVGLAPFFDDTGALNPELLRAACEGKPLAVDISQFDRHGVVAALVAKGYASADYALHGRTLEIKLKEGIYPHNLVGLRDDGKLLHVGIDGLSNRVGVTLTQAAALMAGLGARQSLILDNGNDVFLQWGGEYLVGSAEGDQKRLRSILCFKSEPGAGTITPEDFRLFQAGYA